MLLVTLKKSFVDAIKVRFDQSNKYIDVQLTTVLFDSNVSFVM